MTNRPIRLAMAGLAVIGLLVIGGLVAQRLTTDLSAKRKKHAVKVKRLP